MFRKNEKPKFESQNEERWMHDLYKEVEQAPKNKDELLKTYSRNIIKNQNVSSERPKGRNQVVNQISLSEAIKRSMGWSSRPRRIEQVESEDVETRNEDITRKHENVIQNSQSDVETKDIKSNLQFSKSSLNCDSKPFTPSSRLQNGLKSFKCQNEESVYLKYETVRKDNEENIDGKFENSGNNTDPQSRTSLTKLQNRLDYFKCVKDVKVVTNCKINRKPEVQTSENAETINTHQTLQERFNNFPQIISPPIVSLQNQSKLQGRLNRYKSKPTESLKPISVKVQSLKTNNSTFNNFKVPLTANAEKYHHKQLLAFNNAKNWASYDQSHYDFPIATSCFETLPTDSLLSSSKLQNRLDCFRETISLDNKKQVSEEIKENENQHVEINQRIEDTNHQFLNENSYCPGSSELHDYLDQFRYTTNADVVCTSVENFDPIEESNKSTEDIAVEALSRLSSDQQASLQYISSKIKPKYFSEIYDYYVDYYTEVQCVPLDLPAVNTYLKTQGIAHQRSGTKVIKNRLIQTLPTLRHQKRERKPIKIVKPHEAIEKAEAAEYNKNLDDILENLFTFEART